VEVAEAPTVAVVAAAGSLTYCRQSKLRQELTQSLLAQEAQEGDTMKV
jgi:hypothetical protein